MLRTSIAVLLLFSLACGACNNAEPVARPVAAVIASNSNAPPSSPAPNPFVAVTPPAPPAPGDAGRLPRGAALYFAAHLDILDTLAESVPEAKKSRDSLAKALGSQTLATALAPLGVSGDRPLLVAMVSPTEAVLRKGMEEALKNPRKPTDAQFALGSFIRILIPLKPGAEPSQFVEKIASMEREPEVERCPGAPSCAVVGGDGLVALIRTVGGVISVRTRPGSLEVDQYTPFLPYGTDAKALLGMPSIANMPLGGPEPTRCSRFDPTQAASLCVDPDRTAVFGLAAGYGMSMGSVLMSPGNIDDEQRIRVLSAGKQEAERNIELANPVKRLLDDGTMTFTRKGNSLHAVASWSLTALSKPAVEKAFAKPVCAVGKAFVSDVLPKLSQAFGDPGPDFVRPKERTAHVKDAGWTAIPIITSRSWPNFLAGMLTEVSPQAAELVGQGRVCVVVRNERLEIETGGR